MTEQQLEAMREDIEAACIGIVWIAAATCIGLLAAMVGDYWWGVLGRLGINSPLSWMVGFVVGLGQVCVVAWVVWDVAKRRGWVKWHEHH